MWETVREIVIYFKFRENLFRGLGAVGGLKTRDWKAQDHKNAGMEKAGLENMGPIHMGGKRETSYYRYIAAQRRSSQIVTDHSRS